MGKGLDEGAERNLTLRVGRYGEMGEGVDAFAPPRLREDPMELLALLSGQAILDEDRVDLRQDLAYLLGSQGRRTRQAVREVAWVRDTAQLPVQKIG